MRKYIKMEIFKSSKFIECKCAICKTIYKLVIDKTTKIKDVPNNLFNECRNCSIK